ncbi:type III PLP-dependent enzyme [Ruminobacter amylophilus]|jgi:ornithine decarboxylase|uniref:type III PLP-dependent enzyme n=1 Tax=Ruminobacter amylophilus TaxID=867 RepID=UPI003864B304
MNNLFNTELNYRELISKHGSPLLILDKATVRFQYKELARSLPNVTLHYALKPLPNKDVVASLIEEGASFDLASRGEIDLVRSLNINPMKCIHTHPIKKDQEIKYSLEYGCNTFVVDNAQEAKKFIPYKDEVKLLIRVSFPNPETPVDLSKKFGVLPKDCLELLKLTKSLGLNIHGLSFHVGSQVPNANRHVEAINECAGIIKAAKENGIELNVLDIGGGFPVDYEKAEATNIFEFCAPIREALKQIPADIKIIAEPGRFLSAPAMINICTVVGKAERFEKPWYYLDDGVYCSYSGQIFDHVIYPKFTPYVDGPKQESVLAGPTCDSIDIIAENIELPELDLGDIVVGKMMGAYTISTATEFNFINKTDILVIDTERDPEYQI